MDRANASGIAEYLVNELRPFCARIEIAGSLRRRKNEVGDIDLVVIPSDQGGFLSQLVKEYGRKPDKMGTKYLCLAHYAGIQVDIYLATEQTFPTLWLIRTGSKQHNIMLCQRARQFGLQLKANGEGLLNLKTDACISVTRERDIFDALGVSYREPWEREA